MLVQSGELPAHQADVQIVPEVGWDDDLGEADLPGNGHAYGAYHDGVVVEWVAVALLLLYVDRGGSGHSIKVQVPHHDVEGDPDALRVGAFAVKDQLAGDRVEGLIVATAQERSRYLALTPQLRALALLGAGVFPLSS